MKVYRNENADIGEIYSVSEPFEAMLTSKGEWLASADVQVVESDGQAIIRRMCFTAPRLFKDVGGYDVDAMVAAIEREIKPGTITITEG